MSLNNNIGIVYEFVYNSNNGVLSYFLDFYAKKFDLKYSITKENELLRLFVSGDKDEVVKFNDSSMNCIPNSIFLKKSSVNEWEKELPKSSDFFSSPYANITPSVLKAYGKGELIANEYSIFSNLSIKKDDKFIKITKENFDSNLDYATRALQHNQELFLKDEDGASFSLLLDIVFDDGNILMPTSVLNLSKLFVCDEPTLIALNSFEKPVINLRVSEVYKGKNRNAPSFFDLKLADDLFLFALATSLKDIAPFLTLKNLAQDPKIALLEDDFLIIKNSKFILLDEKKSDKFQLKMAELNLQKPVVVKIELNKNRDDEISLFKDGAFIELLKLPAINSSDELKEQILKDKVGKTLFENYTKEFKFQSFNKDSFRNFYSYFELASRLFFEKDAKKLIENAKLFRGKKGPKIDYKEGFESEFCVDKFIRSGMSFRLGGCDDESLSFGYVESLIIYLDSFLDELKKQVEFNAVILQGELFSEPLFANLAKKLISSYHNINFCHYEL